MYLPLVSQLNDLEYSGARLVNFIPEPAEEFSGMVLRDRHGLVEKFSFGGPVSELVSNGDGLFGISNGALYNIGNQTKIGDCPGAVHYLAATENQIGVVAGGVYCHWDGTSWTQPTVTGITKPIGVCVKDNSFIVWGESATRKDQFHVSDVNDGTSFTFGVQSAESSADGIRAIVPTSAGIFVFGAENTEFWYNAGADGFIRGAGATISIGCLNGKTAVEDNGVVYWVGNNWRVYRAVGFAPETISTFGVNRVSGSADKGFTCRMRQHRQYVLWRQNQPALAYDQDTGLWTEFATGAFPDLAEQRMHPEDADPLGGAWEARCSVERNNVEYLGLSAGVGTISEASFTDSDGQAVIREAITGPVHFGGERRVIHRVRLGVDTGQRPVSGGSEVSLGREPQIMARFSRDGITWGGEKTRGLGMPGDFRRFVTFRNLGQFRIIKARIRVSDPVRANIYGVTLE